LQHPKVSKLSELDVAIAEWEYNTSYWERINQDDQKLSESQQKLVLTNIITGDLHSLLTREAKWFETYEAIKVECQDWIARAAPPKTGGLYALQEPDEEHEEGAKAG